MEALQGALVVVHVFRRSVRIRYRIIDRAIEDIEGEKSILNSRGQDCGKCGGLDIGLNQDTLIS